MYVAGMTPTPVYDRAEAVQRMRLALDLFDGLFDTKFIKRWIA
jgi:hypothetical protein